MVAARRDSRSATQISSASLIDLRRLDGSAARRRASGSSCWRRPRPRHQHQRAGAAPPPGRAAPAGATGGSPMRTPRPPGPPPRRGPGGLAHDEVPGRAVGVEGHDRRRRHHHDQPEQVEHRDEEGQRHEQAGLAVRPAAPAPRMPAAGGGRSPAVAAAPSCSVVVLMPRPPPGPPWCRIAPASPTGRRGWGGSRQPAISRARPRRSSRRRTGPAPRPWT